jgi:hypothetical protein
VQASSRFSFQALLGGFFNRFDVDDVIGDLDGPRHFDLLPFEWLALRPSSSMYEVLLLGSLKTKLSPFFVIVPVNVFA